MTLGVLIHGSVTPREKPYIRFLFVISDFCLQLPSDPRSHGTPLPATIGFQSLWLLKDLRLFPSHLLDLLHARHTKNIAPLELKGRTARRLQEGILYSSPSGATFLWHISISFYLLDIQLDTSCVIGTKEGSTGNLYRKQDSISLPYFYFPKTV